MPVLTGPGCVVSQSCPAVDFPKLPSVCAITPAVGGISDVYIIPCDKELTETNVTDVAWWTDLVTPGGTQQAPIPEALSKLGVGLGSIGKKSTKAERFGSCRIEQTTNITWALKFTRKHFDKTTEDATRSQITTLVQNSGNFLAIARMCDGEDTVLPIGRFTISDVDWVVPDNFEENQSVVVEFAWNELGVPKVYTVAGLSAVLPKTN